MLPHVETLYQAIYAIIRRIPRGRVATYGQVAEMAGLPRGGRVSAAALKVSRPEHHLPWHRVIGKRSRTVGRIAIQDPIGGAVQRELLEREGVVVDERGSVALGSYGWNPKPTIVKASRGRAAPPRPPPRSGSKRRASPSRR
jgi:methylated-DNA-protein-cysteine methyltransferase-like protein